jgi:hypothetical protein
MNVLKNYGIDLNEMYPLILESYAPDLRNFIIFILNEMTICLFYVDKKKLGSLLCDLMLWNKTYKFDRQSIYKNSLFYASQLEVISEIKPEFRPPIIDETKRLTMNPMNPSIITIQDGYIVNYRCVNYVMQNDSFVPIDGSGKLLTRNIICIYDVDFNLKTQREIIDDRLMERFDVKAQGIEDIHLFKYGADVWFSCTCPDTKPVLIPTICMTRLDGFNEYDVDNDTPIFVQEVVPIIGPDPNRGEKNWIPHVYDDEIRMIYSYEPFVVVCPEIDESIGYPTGNNEEILRNESVFDFSRFRGTAGLLEYYLECDDFNGMGHLSVVHEAIDNPGRKYLHRFVFTDMEYNIIKVSRTFFFKNWGVEFCKSICTNHDGFSVILGVGIGDVDYLFFNVSVKTIDRMLVNPSSI